MKQRLRVSDEERFWSKVDKSGDCWLWKAHCNPKGYGRFQGSSLRLLAHRYSWMLSGRDVPSGMLLDHICHTPSCVRPEHLRVVTYVENGQNRTRAASHSVTGVRGVSPSGGKFVAQIKLRGKVTNLGRFNTVKEAEAVVVQARREYMTHSEMDKPYRIASSVTAPDPNGSFFMPETEGEK